MPRYTTGAHSQNEDPWGIRKSVGPIVVVEADTYRIDAGFVTFIKDERQILSLPFSKVGLVAELDDENNIPLTHETWKPPNT